MALLISIPVPPLCLSAALSCYVVQYDPNWGACIFFIVLFALITVGYVVQIEWHKQHRWLHALTLFAAAECSGYIARICLYASPNSNAFKAELIILILAPNLLAFCCYVVLGKLITFAFFQQGDAVTIDNWVVRHPQWIPRFYVASDILCLVIQGVGGGMLSGASTTAEINRGKAVEVAGLALQLFFVATFVLICLYVWVKVKRITPDRAVLMRPSFLVLACLIVLLVLRNAYRTAEFSTGGFTTGQPPISPLTSHRHSTTLLSQSLIHCPLLPLRVCDRLLPGEGGVVPRVRSYVDVHRTADCSRLRLCQAIAADASSCSVQSSRVRQERCGDAAER